MTSNMYFNFCLPQKYTNHTGGKRQVNVLNKIVFSFGLGETNLSFKNETANYVFFIFEKKERMNLLMKGFQPNISELLVT